MSEKKRESPSEFSIKHALIFSSGNISDVLALQAFGFLVFTYYFTIVRINVFLISIGFMIWAVWNAFNDPLLGSLSDRTKSKHGRRFPWLVVAIVPLSLIMILLFTPPFIIGMNDELLNFAYFLIIIIVYEFFYTMYSINQTSAFPEVFIDKVDRAKVNSIKQLFGIIALILAFVLPGLFIPDFTDRQYIRNYWIFGIVTCILVFLCGIIFIKWGYRAKEEFKHEYEDVPPLLESVKLCVKNRNFRWMALCMIMVWFVFGMLTTILPLYGKFVLGLSAFEISLMFGLAFISAMIFVNVWRFVVIKIGPRKTWMISLLVWIVILIPLLFISDAILAYIVFFLMGAGLAAAMFLRDITWADIIDEDELSTGVRREAAYFGVNALFMKFSIILVFLAINLVFTYTGWAVYAPEKVSPQIINGLILLTAVFPIIALAIAIFGFYMYPLHGEKLSDVKEQLAKLHAEKKSKV